MTDADNNKNEEPQPLQQQQPPGSTVLRRGLAVVAGKLIIGAAGLLTGVRAIWSGTSPNAEQTLYFANHTSHGDFVLLWATLPPDLRALTRPVAGRTILGGLEAAQLHRPRHVQRADRSSATARARAATRSTR